MAICSHGSATTSLRTRRRKDARESAGARNRQLLAARLGRLPSQRTRPRRTAGGSIAAHASVADDLAPLGHVVAEDVAELLARQRLHFQALIGKLIAHGGFADDCVHRLIQSRHYGLR